MSTIDDDGVRTRPRRGVAALVAAGILAVGLLGGAGAVGAATDPIGTDPTTTDPSTSDPAGTDPATTDPAVPMPDPIAPEIIEAVFEASTRLAALDVKIENARDGVVETTEAAAEAAADLAEADDSLDRAEDRVERTTAQIAAIEDLLRTAAVGEYMSDGAQDEWLGEHVAGRTDDALLRRALTRYLAKSTGDLIEDLRRQERGLERQESVAEDRRDDTVERRDALEEARDRHEARVAALSDLREQAQVVALESQVALEKAMAARQVLIDELLARLAREAAEAAEAASAPPVLVADEGFTLDGLPLCEIEGFVMACTVAPQVASMVAAARADEVTLTGSGWRSTARQIELRKANCDGDVYGRSSSACSPPTARPGSSNHELGVAIDFDACSSRSTACFTWLDENAERFGFHNLASEPWHWSIDGD